MKVNVDIDVETKEQVQKILEEADLKPLMDLGKKLWEVKGGEFTINIPGGQIIYKPD